MASPLKVPLGGDAVILGMVRQVDEVRTALEVAGCSVTHVDILSSLSGNNVETFFVQNIHEGINFLRPVVPCVTYENARDLIDFLVNIVVNDDGENSDLSFSIIRGLNFLCFKQTEGSLQ